MAYIQSATGSTGGGTSVSLSIAYGSNNAQGNLLILVSRDPFGAGTEVFKVTDTQNNNWVRALMFFNGDQYELWYAANCKAGANTVSYGLASGAATFMRAIIAEYSNVTQTLSRVASLTGSSTAPNSGMISMTNPLSLLIGFVANASADGQSFTPATGWTTRANVSTNLFLCDADGTIPGTGQSFSGSYGNVAWGAGIAGFTTPFQPIVKRRKSVEAALFTGREFAYYITLERLF